MGGGNMHGMGTNMPGGHGTNMPGHGMGGHGTSGHGTASVGHGGGSGHGLQFYFGALNSPILFGEWMAQTDGKLVGSCFAVFFMTMFLFVLDWLKLKLSARYPTSTLTLAKRLTSWNHWIMAILWTIIFCWSYFLMLIVM